MDAKLREMLVTACERATNPQTEKKRKTQRFIPVDSPKFEIKATANAQTEEVEGQAQVIGRIKLSDEYLKQARARARNADAKAKNKEVT